MPLLFSIPVFTNLPDSGVHGSDGNFGHNRAVLHEGSFALPQQTTPCLQLCSHSYWADFPLLPLLPKEDKEGGHNPYQGQLHGIVQIKVKCEHLTKFNMRVINL